MEGYWAIDAVNTVRRDDAIKVSRKSERVYSVEVAIVVPNEINEETGFQIGTDVNSVIGSFELDIEYGIQSYDFYNDKVSISKAFAMRDLDEHSSICFEDQLSLLDIIRVSRILEIGRVRNSSVIRKERKGVLVKEYMVLFNSMLAQFVNEHDIGAIYRVGVGERKKDYECAFEIGPYYTENVYGYVPSSSPLRDSVASFNVHNVYSYLSGGEYLNGGDMSKKAKFLGKTPVNVHSYFAEDFDMKRFRAAYRFFTPDSRYEYKFENKRNEYKLLEFLSSPKKYELKNPIYFEDLISSLEEFSAEEMWLSFLKRVIGNLQLIKYRSVLISKMSDEVLMNLLCYDFEFKDLQWGEVIKRGSSLEIIVDGDSKEFELCSVADLKDFLYLISKFKFAVL